MKAYCLPMNRTTLERTRFAAAAEAEKLLVAAGVPWAEDATVESGRSGAVDMLGERGTCLSERECKHRSEIYR